MKIISLVLFFWVFLYSDIKIYTKKAQQKQNIIYLTKPYLVYNDNFFIQAQKAIVKDKHHAIFYGNVIIFYNDAIIASNKIEIETQDNIKIDYAFFYDKKLDFWIKSKKANIKNKKVIYFKDAIFSSCCVNNPDWYLYIKKGSYNKKTKYLKIHNIILYVHDVPVFYFPFYFNSLNKKRRSGLLRPYIGISTKEGLLYSQPIYFVTSLRNDLEIIPTIRTKRGKGIYSIFRFVDSPYSFGTIKAGVFYDRDSFYKKYNLANKKHYGYRFIYKRDKVFNNDRLYIDFKYANDVDYFYLNPYNYTFNQSYLTEKILTSKLNYFKEFNSSIFGIYSRYFIDTSKSNNDDTIQILPQLNYHLYEKKYNFFLTSLDYNFYNYYRKVGNSYYITNFLLPLSINLNFDFFNLKISEVLKGEYSNYYNIDLPSYYLNTYTQIKLLGSFTKKKSFLHIIVPTITFTKKNYNLQNLNSDIINYSRVDNSLSIDLFQIFKKDDLYIDHTLHQFYNIDLKKGEPLENLINITYNNFSLTESSKYDWELNKFIYNATTFGLNFSKNSFNITHIYQYSPVLKSIDFKYQRDINEYKSAYFEYNYDLENKYPKFWLIGIKLNKKCWQYDFSLKKSLTPVLKENGISYNEDYMLNFSINFNPLGGLKQTILFK